MSKDFKRQAALLREANRAFTSTLVPMDVAQHSLPGLQAAWRSNRFLVQLFGDQVQRITICRTMIDETTGRWLDGITWDEIQEIKRAIGFGHRDAVEVYPADEDVVNVSNMRHIWLVDPLPFAWRRKTGAPT